MNDPLPALTPELQVRDLSVSLDFYIERLGFSLLFERPEQGFAAIVLGKAALMLEQIDPQAAANDPWLVAPLDPPLGRGINLQITLGDVDALHQRLSEQGLVLRLPLEEVTYRVGESQVRVRQLMLQDPDGYLLRFSQRLTG
jgi:catechol 2,3-dioxygenase-like lactoylglutathione lyase family enzyme